MKILLAPEPIRLPSLGLISVPFAIAPPRRGALGAKRSDTGEHIFLFIMSISSINNEAFWLYA